VGESETSNQRPGATMSRQPCVYMLASRRNGTLYVGVTGDLANRVWLHKQGRGSKFTARYKVHILVWTEFHAEFATAIEREKRIKMWKRAWKINLIEATNPDWLDLFDDINM
jgi:putative endonuclease